MIYDNDLLVLEFIEDFIEESGFPPTIREIGRAMDISSTSSVSRVLDRLEESGYIVRARGIARGIVLV